jgi:hypothetical protein
MTCLNAAQNLGVAFAQAAVVKRMLADENAGDSIPHASFCGFMLSLSLR